MSDAIEERIVELEQAVAEDPGAPGFAALAELHRRAGRLEVAERVATNGLAATPDSLDGRAVLALILADAGRDTDLRRTLEAWAASAVAEANTVGPKAETLSVGEIDRAFDSAEADVDEMITPDSVAEEAALRADGPMALESPLESGGAFATRTMADLLERQGDLAGAARIRARLDAKSVAPTPAVSAPTVGDAEPAPRPDAAPSVAVAPESDPQTLGTLAVLERWLDNARRMQT